MNARTSTLVAGLGALALVTAACVNGFRFDDGDAIRGSGNLTSQSRTVTGFDEVVLFGFGEVIVDIDGTEALVVEAEDNLLPYLETDVVGGRLELKVQPDIRLSPTRDVVYRISAIQLAGISVLGSGDVAASGVEADSFSVSISGSGDVATSGAVRGMYDVVINGSGDVNPNGETASLALQINGSGDFRGEDLVVSQATVVVAGSGSVVVNATDRLEVTVTGSGDVEYLGNPTISQTITGSGSIGPR